MRDYVIFADSACDIAPEILKEWNVKYCSLTFTFNDSPKEYSNYELSATEFYKRMRSGAVAKTSAVNADVFLEVFEREIKDGNDILYIGFSSGLSTTYNSAAIAAAELVEKYPESRILTVDSLSASAGYGLMLYLTVRKKAEGASVEEAAEYASSLCRHLCHWFTVDDLVYLKRGGRISPTVALVGSILGIKPVLHMDDEGHLINMFKVRGRKTSVEALAKKYGELISDKTAPIYISHGDCLEDAELLKRMLKEKYNADVEIITDVGPVIGAHSGPGTLALFFIGKNR